MGKIKICNSHRSLLQHFQLKTDIWSHAETILAVTSASTSVSKGSTSLTWPEIEAHIGQIQMHSTCYHFSAGSNSDIMLFPCYFSYNPSKSFLWYINHACIGYISSFVPRPHPSFFVRRAWYGFSRAREQRTIVCECSCVQTCKLSTSEKIIASFPCLARVRRLQYEIRAEGYILLRDACRNYVTTIPLKSMMS